MTLFAGVARSNITPTKSMTLFGYPHVPRISTGVHDPLFATALFLQNGPSSLLIIAVDLLMLSKGFLTECRSEISRRTNLPICNILISVSHTHSGPISMDVFAFSKDPHVPPVDNQYLAEIHSALIVCAIEAIQKAVPACASQFTAFVDGVGCNRHDPDGPRDSQAGLLYIKELASGQPLALDLVYSMHPTVLHEDSTLISADFPGYTRQALEAAFPGLTVLYHTGPAGNQSPRYHVQSQTFAEAERLGLRLADIVNASLKNLKPHDFSAEIKLTTQSTWISLPRRILPSSHEALLKLDEARRVYQELVHSGAPHGPIRTAEVSVFGAEEAYFLSQAQETGELDKIHEQYAETEVVVFLLGEWSIVGFPGEMFVEYALELKKRSIKPVTVISLANGELQGYIVTPEAQGYEASFSLFEPLAGKLMVEAALSLINNTSSV